MVYYVIVRQSNIMRSLTIIFLFLFSFVARSEEISGLSAFAEEYWAAVRSQDPQKIYAFYDPQVFSALSPAETDLMKKYWMQSYSEILKKQGDSYQITFKALPDEANPLPTWQWAARPQYQIEIQTFRHVPNGKEGLTGLTDMVIQKEDRFFIIRKLEKRLI